VITVKTYEPFPKQQLFHSNPAKYRLFGGAAGPGKSLALLWEGIMQALEHPGADVLLLRRTYPELEGSIIRQFRRDVPRELYAGYNESKHLVSFHNGAGLQFGWSESERDVQRFQGGEFVFIGVDELTHFTLGQWQFLTSRNRCRIPGSFPCMAGATNPGGVGHKWVKALWIDKQKPDGWDGRYDPADYEFIPARLEDNPIYANDANYRKTLEELPERLRIAFLEGRWDVFEGQYFDIFDPVRHVVAKPALESWLSRWVSVDWGFEHPTVAYWHAQNGRRTVTYREMVRRHVTPAEIGADIASLSGNEKIGAVYLSPDAFSWRTFAGRRSERPISELIGDALIERGLPRPSPADDDRIGGWMLMYQMLERGDWAIVSDCGKLIECLPNLVRDVKRVEDIAKQDGDDPADAARYGLKSRLGPAVAPLDVRVQERVAALPPPTSPTGHAMQVQQAARAEQQKQKQVFVRGSRFHRQWNWGP
jgi:Terminase large subunit, T4likevirus-type, N-terminal